MTEPTKKPKFRHVAVNGKDAKTGAKYAKELTNTMNQLVEEGYSVQLNEMKNFTVVMGILPEEAPPGLPFMRMPNGAMAAVLGHAGHDEDEPVYSPRTNELLSRFRALPTHSTSDADAFLAEVNSKVTMLTRGFSAEELSAAAQEIDAARVAHEKAHESPNCVHSRSLAGIVAALRATVQTQLQ